MLVWTVLFPFIGPGFRCGCNKITDFARLLGISQLFCQVIPKKVLATDEYFSRTNNRVFCFHSWFYFISSQLTELCVYMPQHCNGVDLLCRDFVIVWNRGIINQHVCCLQSCKGSFGIVCCKFLEVCFPLFDSSLTPYLGIYFYTLYVRAVMRLLVLFDQTLNFSEDSFLSHRFWATSANSFWASSRVASSSSQLLAKS